MTIMEKLEALTPEQQEKLSGVTTEGELDAFIAETGVQLTAEEKTAALNYIKANQKKPEGVAELTDDELDNVAGGHGGSCHKGGREVVTLITTCVHKITAFRENDVLVRKAGDDLGTCNVMPLTFLKGNYQCPKLLYKGGLWLCDLPEKDKL